MPPFAARPARIAAPEELPGSTNANSLNNASGAKHDIKMIRIAGTAVPTAAARSVSPGTTTVELTCTPNPSISTIRTGVNAAAWNQRKLFQNHARPPSQTSPDAAIGVVAANTINATARTIITSRCPSPASHNNSPITPNTVAREPSVMSSSENPCHGCHPAHTSTPSSRVINAVVNPAQAASTAAPYPSQATTTIPNWAVPITALARLRPSRRTAATPTWITTSTVTRTPAAQNVTG